MEQFVNRWVKAAKTFVPELRRRSEEIDQLRKLPQELVERFARCGFYRLTVPATLGGVGTSPETLSKVCEVLATGNGSAAWCVFIGSTSQYMISALEPVQADIILENPNVITSGVFAPTGKALPETRDGVPGYLINGIWEWGSGVHNAEWVSGGVLVPTRDNGVRYGRAYFHHAEIDVDDNWQTSGMRGSGSSTFHARDLWVPESRVSAAEPRPEYIDDPVFRFPQFTTLCAPIAAIALGMAQSCIDEVIKLGQMRSPSGKRRGFAEKPSVHRNLAAADVQIRAARRHLYATIKEVWFDVQETATTKDHRVKLRTAVNHAVAMSVETIDSLFTGVGGAAVFLDSCFQRNFRDVHVATQHMMVAEPIFETAGRIMMGLEDDVHGF